ncbi:MAG TPA: ATP-binding protein, partial [Anaerolineae bacterium]
LGDSLINQLGPAINSRRSIFLFGSTGNGKTSIGLAIGTMLPGAIWIPYAISVEGQFIKLFDALHHRAISETMQDDEPMATERSGLLSHLSRGRTSDDEVLPSARPVDRYDRRWVRIHRPLIVSGGELTLKNFSLVLDPTTKYYEAPQQMKANGGVFLVDDLGRQPVSPREILNRWIVPLEKQVDYLTLATGYRFQVPFDALILFATNLNPEQVVDEVILRRIRNQIHIPDPTWEEFREIFRREAANRTIPYSDDCLQHIIMEYYVKCKRRPRGVHPRDLLDELVDVAHFQQVPPIMSIEMMDQACRSYFLI